MFETLNHYPTIIAVLATLVLFYANTKQSRRVRRLGTRVDRLALKRSRQRDKVRETLESTTKLRVYYYLDDALINSLYDQLRESDLVLVSRETEHEKSHEGSVGVKFRAIATSWKRGGRQKQRDTLQVQVNSDYAMTILEKRLLERDAVSLIELDPTESSVLTHLEPMMRRTGFDPSEATKATLENEWRDFHRKLGIDRIKTLKNYAVVSGDFVVTQEATGNLVLAKALIVDSTAPPQVRLLLEEDGLRSPGKVALQVGRSARVTVFGKVLRWDESTNTMDLLAMSVF